MISLTSSLENKQTGEMNLKAGIVVTFAVEITGKRTKELLMM